MREVVSVKPTAISIHGGQFCFQTKLLRVLLLLGFGGIVLYPTLYATFLMPRPAALGYLLLFFLWRFVLFFCWFQLTGYWFFRSLSRYYISSPGLAPDSRPQVAILVPIRDEPLDVVRRMLEHLRSIDYAPFTIIIIDNSSISQRTILLNMADKLAVAIKVVRKPTAKGFKAGALNRALATLTHDVRYVLVLDVDHAPRRGVLQALVPILEADHTLAFVQAPQTYLSLEQSLIGTAFRLKQRVFYDQICPGLSVAGCMFMSGSNTLIRMESLQQAGGFDESSLTEDLRTSLRMHSLGWKGFYTSQNVATGYAPMTFAAYHRQLRRWAIGTFQNWVAAVRLLLRTPTKLSIEQWLFYLGWNGLFYFQGVAAYILLLLSLAQLFLRTNTDTAAIDNMIAFCMGATAFSMLFYQHRRCQAKMLTLSAGGALFYGDLAIMLKALLDLLRGHRIVFDVTPKANHGYGRPALWFMGFHFVICIAIAGIAGYAALTKAWSTSWMGMFWPVVCFVQSAAICLIALATRSAEVEHVGT